LHDESKYHNTSFALGAVAALAIRDHVNQALLKEKTDGAQS
jgi:hypothetical protein